MLKLINLLSVKLSYHCFRRAYEYSDSPKCACGAPVECRLYNVLHTEILGPFPPEMTNRNKGILLYGDATRSTDWNMNLLNGLEKYILRTNRFNTGLLIDRPCPIYFFSLIGFFLFTSNIVEDMCCWNVLLAKRGIYKSFIVCFAIHISHEIK